jgi:hypothetical protein
MYNPSQGNNSAVTEIRLNIAQVIYYGLYSDEASYTRIVLMGNKYVDSIVVLETPEEIDEMIDELDKKPQ